MTEVCLTCPRWMGIEIIKAAGLPESLGDLWVVEAFIDGNGTTTYNVERLGVVLAANDLQIGRGQQTAYIPFALCRTRTHAQETIDRMKRKQATLAALNEPRDESGEDLGVTICMEADVASEGVPV